MRTVSQWHNQALMVNQWAMRHIQQHLDMASHKCTANLNPNGDRVCQVSQAWVTRHNNRVSTTPCRDKCQVNSNTGSLQTLTCSNLQTPTCNNLPSENTNYPMTANN